MISQDNNCPRENIRKETNIRVNWFENRRELFFIHIYLDVNCYLRCNNLWTTNTTNLEEIIRCSSCHVRFSTSRRRIELEAEMNMIKYIRVW